MDEVAISVEGVTKSYDGAAAVREVTLAIGRGEFFSLLGPSGCGKTTTLRMVAGFVTPDSGRIVLAGRDVTGVPANRRPVNMVFQHYALFPHMTVYDNVAFGLKMKKAPRSTHRARVQEILDVVELEGFERRHIRHLSGGQQQRVALARALVNRPEALLLDEPLGALDVKLRRQMQLELKRIQHDLGTTFVYVTHDQEEALAMSDRIAVMNAGVVEQVGTPRELYEHPQSAFAADFIGSLNVLDVVVGEVDDGRALIRFGERSRIAVPVGRNVHAGDTLKVAVRPERVRLTPGAAPADEECALEGTVAQVVFLGMYTQYHVDTQAGMLLSHRLSDDPIEPGSRVTVAWDPDEASTL
jgi:spermidine/putrescine transport system ATP-binding protein